MTNDELIKALRLASTVSTAWGKIMQDAAAAIEELDAEETRLLLLTSDLQDKLMDLQEQLNDAEIAADDNGRQVDTLQAEIRESMQKCAECSKWNEPLQVGKAGNQFTLNAMEQPHWVSVNERLPDDTNDVLIVRRYGNNLEHQEVMVAHIAVIMDLKRGCEKWWSATNVTHWMPLPEPPKEVKE